MYTVKMTIFTCLNPKLNQISFTSQLNLKYVAFYNLLFFVCV